MRKREGVQPRKCFVVVGDVAGSVEAVWFGAIPGEEPADGIWQKGVSGWKEGG